MADVTTRGYAYLLFLRVLLPALIDLVLGLLLASVTFFASAGLALVSTAGVAVIAAHGQLAALALGGVYALVVLIMAIRRYFVFSKLVLPHPSVAPDSVSDSAENSRSV
jgi:hypothetical protein